MLLDLRIREDILKFFPNYEYFSCLEPDRIDFNKLDNLVGVQQESFLIYWILKQIREHPDHGGGLDLGCGQGVHFACIGLNDYYGDCHPIYRGAYHPHITSLAEDVQRIFNKDTFNFLVCSHILEHVENPRGIFREWCKLLRKDGIIILLMPDAQYEKCVGSWDPTHKTFWTVDDFKNNCILPNQDLMKLEEFDTLKNKFSMNAVMRRL